MDLESQAHQEICADETQIKTNADTISQEHITFEEFEICS